MSHKHKEEIIRWANAEKDTNVFYKINTAWAITKQPSWSDYVDYYILDDEYAELRKAFVDGKTIQARSTRKLDCTWISLSEPSWCNPVNMYRIKPETVTKWQWLYSLENGSYGITGYYTTKQKAALRYTSFEFIKVQESRKSFKC